MMKHAHNSRIAVARFIGARSACLVALLALLSASCQTAKERGAQVAQAPNTMNANVNMNSNMNMSGNMNSDIALASTAPHAVLKESIESQERNRGERYAHTDENPYRAARRAPLSTFSVDVDTASYSNTRRFINDGSLPPPDAVRVEEFVNYFTYDYPQPVGDAPFAVVTEAATCPWNRRHRIVSVGLQGRRQQTENLPPANLVFLVDVSGSMQPADRLPLLKRALHVLAEQLTARDRVAMVVYAGSSGLALPSTSGDRQGEIAAAIDNLDAGGSTNGGEGIHLAYRVAQQNFKEGGINRVILATDGDFNVGVTGDEELVSLIEEKRRGGVFLTVLGFGTGNLNDSMMEKLADRGNGNYAYIDSLGEARKVLGAQIGGTLATIAKDVKIQVEFNPHAVAAYRLIGYENRLLRAEDFNDDTKDAGEIGAGHSVTALYEVVPAGVPIPETGGEVTPLKYNQPTLSADSGAGEMMTVQLRYKEPEGDVSRLVSTGVANAVRDFGQASENLRFASAVAAFGMLLKDSPHKGDATFDGIAAVARAAASTDLQGYRGEFVQLVGRAKKLAKRG